MKHAWEIRKGERILVGKLEGKRPLGRSRHIWEYNIRIYLRELWLDCVDWIHLVGSCKHGYENSSSVNSMAGKGNKVSPRRNWLSELESLRCEY